MVDARNLADILYFDAFQKLGLTKDLSPMASTLIGFTEDSISPLDTTTLPVTIGEEPRFIAETCKLAPSGKLGAAPHNADARGSVGARTRCTTMPSKWKP
ncbi:hypothetical protein BHE74_00024057 [Ensete ventricosum]|nr:hypothetical protein GW17_00031742 [Ensete ventricosum]RWW68417.1 hypothetical protein BHE74_00024057 [Ensete ventricosum]RZR86174.1 hypothetical protein BHM03_00013320 [Ensete ventricosum]